MIQQADLFNQATSEFIQIDLPDADVRVYPGWLANEKANAIMAKLEQDLPWEQPEIVIAGQRHLIPRKQVWVGDPGAVMRYSGRQFQPIAWHPEIARLKHKIEALCETGFNSVLVNLYRNGADSVSWHADDEIELGPQPLIASLSLGAERRFSFKSRNKTEKTRNEKARHIVLKNGDLVIMKQNTQRHWLHCVPKCDISTPQRINLTFRQIVVMS